MLRGVSNAKSDKPQIASGRRGSTARGSSPPPRHERGGLGACLSRQDSRCSVPLGPVRDERESGHSALSCRREGILGEMPYHGPYTRSDLGEPDDFVQGQLLLANALQLGFRCEGPPKTVFRDDLLGLGLLWVPGSRSRPEIEHRVMQALCHREHTRAQWRVIGFRPAPRWMRYGPRERNENGELGVVVERLPPQEPREAVLPDGALVTSFHNMSFRVTWDAPGPPRPFRQEA